jgi:HPt (histidine-containing phosphotransfer) domain-containing protein
MEAFLDAAPSRTSHLGLAVTAGCTADIAVAASALKLAAESVGAAALVDAARSIEILARHGALEHQDHTLQRLETEMASIVAAVRNSLVSHAHPGGMPPKGTSHHAPEL